MARAASRVAPEEVDRRLEEKTKEVEMLKGMLRSQRTEVKTKDIQNQQLRRKVRVGATAPALGDLRGREGAGGPTTRLRGQTNLMQTLTADDDKA